MEAARTLWTNAGQAQIFAASDKWGPGGEQELLKSLDGVTPDLINELMSVLKASANKDSSTPTEIAPFEEVVLAEDVSEAQRKDCLLYTSPSPRD